MKKMQICADCGFIQEGAKRCEACDSTALNIETIHDNQLLRQEQMQNSFIEADQPIPMSIFSEAESLDFMGEQLTREDYPLLFEWALTNAWSLETEITSKLNAQKDNTAKQILVCIYQLEEQLSAMTSEQREAYLKSKY